MNKLRLLALCVIILLVLLFLYPTSEHLSGPGWPEASGEPVPYGQRRPCPTGAICIRRWRTPIPVGKDARSVSDDVWARTYASGTGFQLA
jgi:di/tricarboxylate transporter